LNGFSAGSNVVKSGVPTDELERLKKQNNWEINKFTSQQNKSKL
jgi:hypothetical protein